MVVDVVVVVVEVVVVFVVEVVIVVVVEVVVRSGCCGSIRSSICCGSQIHTYAALF